MVHLTLLALAVYAIAAYASPCPTQQGPTATIDSGVVVGMPTSLPNSNVTVNKFLGIPFAEPPVRFSPPEAVASWDSVYDASAYRPACLQQWPIDKDERARLMALFNTPPPPAGESEDCLHINVFAPAGATEKPKAVMFWIFGGAFTFGHASWYVYDGTHFATEHDVVVVTANYRTNIFGFPGSPDAEPNLGLLDQRLALDWVHRNIAALGGDPDKVTLFGQSAGGGSVDNLVTSPPDPLPFRAAIVQSGQATVYEPIQSSADAWANLTTILDCLPGDELQCVRDIPATELVSLIEKESFVFNPIHDGGETWSNTPRTDRLESTEKESLIARVPLLIGTNAQEGKLYVTDVNDTAAYLKSVGVPALVIPLLLLGYPIGSPGVQTENDRAAKIYTELVFQCNSKIVSEDTAKVGIDSWRYFYNASFPNSEIFPGSGAYHTAELAPLWGTFEREGATELQMEVSNALQTAWTDFAKDPTSGPGWEAVPEVGVFGGPVPGEAFGTVENKVLDSRCFLYNSYYDGLGE